MPETLAPLLGAERCPNSSKGNGCLLPHFLPEITLTMPQDMSHSSSVRFCTGSTVTSYNLSLLFWMFQTAPHHVPSPLYFTAHWSSRGDSRRAMQVAGTEQQGNLTQQSNFNHSIALGVLNFSPESTKSCKQSRYRQKTEDA